MLTIKKIVYNAFVLIILLPLCLVYLIPFLILLCIPQKKRLESRWASWIMYSFYRFCLWSLLLPITVHGKKNVPNQPAIFIANHQSSLDILILGNLLGSNPHIWLARSDAVKSAIIRYFMSFFSIIVDLSSPASSYRSIRTLLSVANGTSAHLILFPEGGRFTDGSVHDFVEGFVFLAKKTGRPVIPVCILGIQHVYPPTAYLLSRYPIYVIIGEPVTYTEAMSDEMFKQKISSWYQQQIRSY